MSEEVKEMKKDEKKQEKKKFEPKKEAEKVEKTVKASESTEKNVEKDSGKKANEKASEAKEEKKEGAGEKPAPTPAKRKKGKKHVPVGTVHVRSTFNNTIITFADMNGNTVAWASAGGAGFKGSRKSTPFAAQVAAEAVAAKARDVGMRSVTIFVKGPGGGRESAVRAIQKSGIRITAIRDVTPIPHNGCRPPKRRRV